MEERIKCMRSLVIPNLRQLVSDVNELKIERSDIVSIERSGEHYVLLYFA